MKSEFDDEISIDEDRIYEFKAMIVYKKYYNHDTGWGVFNFKTIDELPLLRQPEKSDSDFEKYDTSEYKDAKFGSLAGKTQELIVGAEYSVKAKIRKDRNYGYQYSPIAIYALIPQTRETQVTFLKSIIGERVANNLLNAYPNIVNDVANGTIDTIDYSNISGIKEFTWNRIKDKIISNYLVSDIIVMLKPLGVTFTMIKKLLDDEPNPALLKKKIKENVYYLCKIRGLGFRRVDELALKIHPESVNKPERLIAYVKYFLEDMGESDGHTWCSRDILKENVDNNVIECADQFDWLLENGTFLHIDGDRIGLKRYHYVEMKIFNILRRKVQTETEWKLSDQQIDRAIKKAEKEQGFEYTSEQLDAIKATLGRTVSLITGKAGVGKSTILRAIIQAYKMGGYSIAASALSAMASQRITEATSFHARTIHRTLGCRGANIFEYNADNQLLTDVAFLDEGSMVNASLFLHWLEAISDETRIVISGDHKQLPPIGYGNVFSDLIEVMDKSCVSQLVKPMRQAERSGILVDANLIRENKNPITEKMEPKLVHGELQDMFYMFRTNRESLFNIAINTYMKSVDTDGIDNVAIIVPRKKDCLNSTKTINEKIQNLLLGDEKLEISFGDSTFKLGAKVMQIVNNYDKNVFNGDIGYITYIGNSSDPSKKELVCKVEFKDVANSANKKEVEYTAKQLTDLELAYAVTVHKIQGGASKTVIGIIDNTHYQLLDNCMLYTLLTRAKKRCLLLAEPQAFLKCIRTSHNSRNTWIKEQVEKG